LIYPTIFQHVIIMANRTRPRTIRLDEIPKKIYYSISEASDYTGVEPHVLRYWETKFSRLNPKRVGGNQRKYTRGDLELLLEIVNLLYNEGYTLDGAERKLRGGLQALRAERNSEKVEAAPPSEIPASDSASPAAREPYDLAAIKRDLQEILRLLE